MTLQVWPWLCHLFDELLVKTRTNSYWTYASNYIAIKSKKTQDKNVLLQNSGGSVRTRVPLGSVSFPHVCKSIDHWLHTERSGSKRKDFIMCLSEMRTVKIIPAVSQNQWSKVYFLHFSFCSPVSLFLVPLALGSTLNFYEVDWPLDWRVLELHTQSLLSSGDCLRNTTVEACSKGSVMEVPIRLGTVLSMRLWDCPSWLKTQFQCDLKQSFYISMRGSRDFLLVIRLNGYS